MHDISVERKAEAFFRGTVVLRDLAERQVVPILVGMVRKTGHEEAVVGTYYRMHIWVLSLAKLDYPVHCQTVLNATRAMFELLVDLKLLVCDASLTEKYH